MAFLLRKGVAPLVAGLRGRKALEVAKEEVRVTEDVVRWRPFARRACAHVCVCRGRASR